MLPELAQLIARAVRTSLGIRQSVLHFALVRNKYFSLRDKVLFFLLQGECLG